MMLTDKRELHEVAENVRRLAGSPDCPPPVRQQAESVRDLLDLAANWPLPPSLDLGEDIRVQLSGLCESSGLALCTTQYCVASGSTARGRCPVVPA
jgi:hypothetical protein